MRIINLLGQNGGMVDVIGHKLLTNEMVTALTEAGLNG